MRKSCASVCMRTTSVQLSIRPDIETFQVKNKRICGLPAPRTHECTAAPAPAHAPARAPVRMPAHLRVRAPMLGISQSARTPVCTDACTPARAHHTVVFFSIRANLFVKGVECRLACEMNIPSGQAFDEFQESLQCSCSEPGDQHEDNTFRAGCRSQKLLLGMVYFPDGKSRDVRSGRDSNHQGECSQSLS